MGKDYDTATPDAKQDTYRDTPEAEIADPPAGGFIVGTVWWCGDEYCDCSQAQITWRDRYRWEPGRGPLEYRRLWEGEFHTDGAPGANAELNHIAQRLRRHRHDLYARIQWPWSP